MKPIKLACLALLVLGVFFMSQGLFIKAKAQLAQYLISQAWDKQHSSRQNEKPWPWADTYPVAKLSWGDLPGQMVLSGANARNLAFGPVLQMNTAQPGRRGNVVIYGHNDTHFSSLSAVAIGDSIKLETKVGTQVVYEVSSVHVVDESDTVWVEDLGDNRLTLVTCYPFNDVQVDGEERYIIVAHPAFDIADFSDFSFGIDLPFNTDIRDQHL
ncbi:class GN sortase [Enterovibrio nigricans]|uniref:Sortase A n=1 Tax=Enterovibrio nigricans DSM 22720 TaxID=1121868 RepID=A0A1T4ULL9_9GAMM|nr:class GN sortase [Enterovibrio nigricans]PKF49083.1 class GN sortase [Enterovibrio nigricans]SKA53599.1 sortase A [Enterovibrio nigricans DSM 22720]